MIYFKRLIIVIFLTLFLFTNLEGVSLDNFGSHKITAFS